MKRNRTLVMCVLLASHGAVAGSLTTDKLTVEGESLLYGDVYLGPVTNPTSGYVLAYDLDSAATPVADASTNANSGTVSGATWTNGGLRGGAYTFDGTDDYVQAADSASLDIRGAFTISTWARFNATNSVRSLYSKHDDGTNQAFDLHFENGLLVFLMTSSGNNTSRYQFYVSTAVATPTWSHYVVTWDGTPNANAKVYVNNTNQTLQILATYFSGTNIYNSSMPFRLGGKANGGWPFSGAIDDVRVYNRALSAQEVGALYAHGMGEAAPARALEVAPSVAATFSGTTTITRLVPQGDIEMGVYTNGP